MATDVEHDELDRADLAKRDTGDASVGFLDGFGDLAGSSAATVPHILRA